MLFQELIDTELEDELKPDVERLLEIKRRMPEIGEAPKIQSINDYIEKTLPEIKEIANSLEENKVVWNDLNQLFLRMI